MIVKKYIVSDIKEAMIRAKYELGPDAMILNQRKTREKKWYNPFSKEEWEVLVALEESKVEANEIKNIEEDTKDRDIETIISLNPIFKDLTEKQRDQLLGYCKLNQIEIGKLSSEDTVDFIRYIYKNNCYDKKVEEKKINMFVGPTGVGKTTNIAKIAAIEHINKKKKVGLMTIDTYRIGAVDQLKTYADILGIPFEVVEDPEDINEKIKKLEDCDIILIDTLGTSQKNKEKMEDIKEYIDIIEEDKNVFLTMSMSTNKEIMYSILDRYKIMNYTGIILTKFDEVVNYDNFWNVLKYGAKPIEFFSFGQNVPEDIKEASLTSIIEYEGVL